ncbi:hypothetical protein JT359_19835 [Candidatus Poribacteria bacterium]|nr:hypothetical protein [Candidatus Poribacteria bacterium]
MKCFIRQVTLLFVLVSILLVGSSGCAQKTELAKKATPEPNTIMEYQIAAGLPAELTPTENPYQDITITNEAPPFVFYNNPVYWVPELNYTKEWDGINHGPIDNYRSFPDIPALDVKVFNTKIEQLRKERGGHLSRVERGYIYRKMGYSHLTPLNAAKAMLSVGTNSPNNNPYLLEVAQHALDANPDDFHTLLIWTEAQPYKSENIERGYRQLLQKRPNNAYVLLRLGLTLRFKNRQESIELFKKAVQYAPPEKYGSGDKGIHVRDWALQELAKIYFWEGEKQKSRATFQYLQQITTDDATRKRATEYLVDIEEGYKFGRIGLSTDNNKGKITNE